MMVVFEMHVVPGEDVSTIFSDEVKRETGLQVLRHDELARAGLSGMPAPKPGTSVLYVLVKEREARWVHQKLEASNAVAGFQMHPVG